MGLEPEQEWTLNSGQKVQHKYWSGAGSRSGVDPPQSAKLRHIWDWSWRGPKIQVKKYNPNIDLELDLDLELNPHYHNELMWDMNGTGTESEWTLNSGQKVQPQYGSAAGSVLKNKATMKIFHPHTKREKENVQIEMCHKLILQNILET